MYPDSRVLVGVINRKRDLDILLKERWYRVPQSRKPLGVQTDYLAFFLSGKAVLQGRPPGVYLYAQYKGVELAYRHQLLPNEASHKRANTVYYKIQVGDVQTKTPPILNVTKRPITFVSTTGDRFVAAAVIADLYSEADQFVDRLVVSLEKNKIQAYRSWDADKKDDPYAPGLSVLCESGPVYFSPEPREGTHFLDRHQGDDAILKEILDTIARNGGAVTLSLPT